MTLEHTAILINHQSHTQQFVDQLLQGAMNEVFKGLKTKKGLLFSSSAVAHFIDEEDRHDKKILTATSSQSLRTMSSGEQKKALLEHLLAQSPDFIILVNPFDNLDTTSQSILRTRLQHISTNTLLIQLINRLEDSLPFTQQYGKLNSSALVFYKNKEECATQNLVSEKPFLGQIPIAIKPNTLQLDELVKFEDVSVRFGEKLVLKSITWTIRPNEFWQLIGPNGSGKTTLLTMISGESHKGYGQNLQLFGQKKGSGESIWEIKQHIGYFTPSIIATFKGYQTLEYMLISGLYDSIGLYVKPTETELRLANEWLNLLGLHEKRKSYFYQLSEGEKRLLMTARAMIKHPPLLILDEPTVGLDSENALLFVALVNKIAEESQSTIIYVSHRNEIGLKPKWLFELKNTPMGSVGVGRAL